MTAPVVIGIDTSNYTTSLSLMDTDGKVIVNLRRLLSVEKGARGLRQSDAVFAHIKNIPELMTEFGGLVNGRTVLAVGVSATPRRQEGSYMPCFLTGVAVAKSIAACLGVPLYEFSHQCGHIMAAVHSCGNTSLISSQFGAFHVSGGTTELLRVKAYHGDSGFDTELVGKTLDLNAGQVIDRIGVALGLDFPAGNALDALAREYNGKIPKKKPSVNGLDISLSGLENMAIKLYADTGDKSQVAVFVFDYIGNSLIAMTDAYQDRYGKSPMVYAGGVMRNSIIRKRLSERYDAYFAEPDMSSDNAVGIAALTLAAKNEKS